MKTAMLIVEDKPDISHVLSVNFKKDGYDVATARSAEAGLKLARERNPAVVLSDIMLPNMSGLEMLRELRQFSAAPVLFLTAKKDEVDRILGLKLGAADYVTKPFSLEELRLRVKRLLQNRAPAAASDAPLRVGGAEVDLKRHLVSMNGRPVNLTPREFQLLQALIEAQGKVLSREQLAAGFYGDEQSAEMDPRGVDQCVARLRKKFEPERHLIATVSKSGYRIRMGEPLPAGSRRTS